MILIPLVLSATLAVDAAAESASATPAIDFHTVLLTSIIEPSPSVVPAALAAQDDEEEEPVGVWTGQVNIGGTFTEGNTDRKTGAVTIDGTQLYENGDRITLGFGWSFTQQDDANGSSIARRTEGRAKYDLSLSERSYVWLNAYAMSDKPLDGTLPTLDIRWTAGAGIGYHVLDNDEWKWAVEAGLAFFNEEYEGGRKDDYLAARLASISAWNYSEDTNFSNFIELYPSLDESDDVYGRSDTRANTNLTESMVGSLQWIWDWDNTPATGRERSDHLFLVTVGWGF